MTDKAMPRRQIKLLPRTLHKRLEREEELREARKSLIYAWYQCLLLSEQYLECCEKEGKGAACKPYRETYKDFGDVRVPFSRWWFRRGRMLFGEKQVLPRVQTLRDEAEIVDHCQDANRLVISIPLTMRRATAMRKVVAMLAEAHSERGRVDIWKASTATRKLNKSKVRRATIDKLLELWELRREQPELTLYDLGVRAGVELDLLARSTEDTVITEEMERRRMTIEVSRQLIRARYMIENAALGVFPLLKKPNEMKGQAAKSDQLDR